MKDIGSAFVDNTIDFKKTKRPSETKMWLIIICI